MKEQGVVIIAEAGVNHNGDVNLAKKLIDEAKKAGVDYVKFQTFKTELGMSKDAPKAEYQIEALGESVSQYDMVKALELSFEEHKLLADYCKEKEICYSSTGFDKESLDFLQQEGMIDFVKIPSGEITNYPYLLHCAAMKLPIVLSTGMATREEIRWSMQVLEEHGCSREEITVLHCNTEYPTPYEDVNLHAMLSLQEELGVEVGYSDHTQGIEIPIAAVALGAKVIEKHFTLDRTMEGPDHKASLEPQELQAMVCAIRHIEQALGNGIKEPSNSEKKNIVIARKSIVASCAIKKGEVLTEENLTCMRPGDGISPMRWKEVVGSIAVQDYQRENG